MRRSTSYYGNSWIGMFAVTNNDYTLVPVDTAEKFSSVIKENLDTEVIPLAIAGSNLIGIYAVMNSKGIVVPDIIEEKEISVLKETGLEIYVCGDKNNANGNNISLNDSRGIVSVNMDEKEMKGIEDVLKVKLKPMKVSNYVTVGSTCICNNRGFLVHYAVSRDELNALENVFGFKGSTGTVNTGTGFVSLGSVINDKSYVVGEMTTAFEMGRIEDALGFLD
ncbi:translation initiation factor IF-6 [Candidatus Micrarchaeota archaeon]|nr:translation initiation factor IF-6 [Candidatus Micrarchaeota archaeon]